MNNMNPLYQELIVRRQIKELETEIYQMQLDNGANPPQKTGWVAHCIAHFAEWMIDTGESLRQRYNHASMHDCAASTKALAQ